MTTEEICDFNINNENKEIVEGCADLDVVINLKGDCSHEIKRRLSRV